MTQAREGLCLRIVRPIHDPAATDAALVAEAEALLAERARTYNVSVRRGAEIQIERRRGYELEEWHGWSGDVLIATVAVSPAEADDDQREAEALIADRWDLPTDRAPIDPNRLDVELVELCLRGNDVMLSPAEQELAVHLGIKRRITKRRLSQLLHLSATEVNRYLARKQGRGLVRAA